MTASQTIAAVSPFFLLLIALEWFWARRKGRDVYSAADAINSLGTGILSQITVIFTKFLRIGIYAAASSAITWLPEATLASFWTTWYGWLLALVFYDFCYYWLHRAGHECAIFWAAHSVHHQSQRYNLSTALRQTSTGALWGWIFYLPMALAGVPPAVFAVVAMIDLLYQFWVHTELIGKLGWFDRVFCSPSNHRVHHAINEAYIDKNYGGILVLWDRLFGSFQEENPQNPCVYGTRTALCSWDPLWANIQNYHVLLLDSWHAPSWRSKLLVWIKAPGWKPPKNNLQPIQTAFSLSSVRTYAPHTTTTAQRFAILQFCFILVLSACFLWYLDRMPTPNDIIYTLALTVGLWTVGALLQGRISVWTSALIYAALLSTATGVLGLTAWHWFFKPLALLLIIVFTATPWQGTRQQVFLIAGLCASLLGDTLLMLPNYFVWGLAAFLIAHLFYIAALKFQMPWFASKPALFVAASFSATMYAYLWSAGLPIALRLPVAAYVIVITLMGAQALGRAFLLRSAASILTAVGALLFMLSDSLLAINRFALPLPLASLWVLGTYYAAQILIAAHLVRKNVR